MGILKKKLSDINGPYSKHMAIAALAIRSIKGFVVRGCRLTSVVPLLPYYGGP